MFTHRINALGHLRKSIAAKNYFTSTLAPASSNFFLISSASAFSTFSFTGFGAPSTTSFASFKPKPVISRTALITAILLPPAEVRITSNSVCSSSAGAAAPPATATATGAAALTPNSSSKAFLLIRIIR